MLEDGRDVDKPFAKVGVICSHMRGAEEKCTKRGYFDGFQVRLVANMALYQGLSTTVTISSLLHMHSDTPP